MSNYTRAMVMAAAIVAISGATRAQAQVIEPMKFTTTFAFTAGHTRLPAGHYTVRPLDMDPGVMELSNGQASWFIEVENAGAKLGTKVEDKVVFKKEADGYALSQIWDGADGTGVMTPIANGEETHHHHHTA